MVSLSICAMVSLSLGTMVFLSLGAIYRLMIVAFHGHSHLFYITILEFSKLLLRNGH